MKQQMLKERVELLSIVETLGYPRLGFGQSNGRKWSVRSGKSAWEKFCAHGHVTRLVTALRNARILRDNGVVPYNPRTVEQIRLAPMLDEMKEVMPDALGAASVHMTAGAPVSPPPAHDLLDEVEIPKWTPPGTVKVYPPGKRRKYPVRKNQKRDA